jgi:hypothetical protein
VASHTVASLVLSIVLLATLSASERVVPECPADGDVVAKFDVQGRAAILEAIPHIGVAPELTAAGIVVDGVDQMPPDGTYHLVLYRCVPGGFMPILGGLRAGGSPILYGVMRVTSPTGFDISYTGVDFADLRMPRP